VPDLTDEMSDVDYLRDLAERIFRIPVMHGVDQSDYERLLIIARYLARKDDVLTCARNIVAMPPSKYGYSDIGEILVMFLRAELGPTAAIEKMHALNEGYIRTRARTKS
jgi:hypothetical protein